MENTTTLPVFDITAPYHIKREYYRDGFTAFQKKFVMKRNYVMMALFFVLLVSGLWCRQWQTPAIRRHTFS